MLLGTVFIVLSCISFGVVIPALAASDDISSAILWLCIPLGLLHFGLFVGFLGFMLAAPLGEASRNSD